ncbi:FAD-dependent oxidoreductase [Halieaceae bacterium IMCC14734]|uniref:FAD-dependent oxidoreductase n=1 Tax=Candidatus Litorirhabdus singularis TaxID=2518993 RepID=A0ABT3TI06_9GAMM|nr:FAD-dependent oxidoreductase [Candidatus Litorirhabdus singularis]MCX2981634.1 FAD-dependent oxidoreductase [Candidatus Litorirhabdus singularis]
MAVQENWDESVDVLVVGSGNGGMTAALCCYEMGSEDVLLIEKSDLYGGTSSISGGGVWVPCNRYAMAAGADDSPENAKTYLMNCIPADRVPEHMIDTYIEQAPKMVDFLHERTQVRYVTLEHYPDYYSDQQGSMPGHRSMEPETINASELRGEHKRLRRTHHMMHLFGLIGFTQVEAALLMAQMPGWFSLAFKLIAGYILDIPWRLFGDKYARRLATGCAGVARLRLSMLDRDMPLWLNSPMQSLITEDGRVVGAVVERDGKTVRVQARKAVILAAGGFEHNQEMREKYLPQPTDHRWSGGAPENVGDAINEGLRLGAKMHMLDSAWWCTTISVPGEPSPRLSIMEKSYPGTIVVNTAGERFSNESQNYMAYQIETFEKHSDEYPCVPSWQIFDASFRASYMVGPLYNSKFRPDWALPKRFEKEGFFAKAETISELAEKIDVDAAGLEKTIEKFNGYAATGKDLDLQRGDTVYDRYYGDPRVEPNPCLAPIMQAPFYAMKVDPGDFGTQGGMVVTANAEVVHESGDTIPGLYAIGNCSAPVLPNYPGPGSTLGPAMTFGYQAAKHITGWQE